MADGPKDFRDPKVTDTTTKSSGGIGKWIAIAVAVLLGLLLLGWLLGLFGGDDTVTIIDDDATPAVVTTD